MGVLKFRRRKENMPVSHALSWEQCPTGRRLADTQTRYSRSQILSKWESEKRPELLGDIITREYDSPGVLSRLNHRGQRSVEAVNRRLLKALFISEVFEHLRSHLPVRRSRVSTIGATVEDFKGMMQGKAPAKQ